MRELDLDLRQMAKNWECFTLNEGRELTSFVAPILFALTVTQNRVTNVFPRGLQTYQLPNAIKVTWR